MSVDSSAMEDSAGNRVSYCCVWKEGRVVCKYSIGNHEIDNMAALCLELIPPFHRSYSQTIAAHTFAFLMDDGFVYFAILRRHTLTNSHLLAFLQNLRDEFTHIGNQEEQFTPVVRRLVASLERGGTATMAWPAMNGAAEAGTSTKAPLLARPCKQDKNKKKKKKKKNKDDAVVARDIETPEHRRSTDSERTKSSTQNLRDKWCRQVRIVLAIDAAVCLLLLVIWLVICHGIECIR